MVGILTNMCPEIFEKPNKNGEKFKCTIPYVRRYLKKTLKWSVRCGTRAAQKTPEDVDNILSQAFLRMAASIREASIDDGAFLVNTDQTQVIYAMGPKLTWNESGVKQVDVLGTEEKRAFTLVVGVSASGEALPFQAVFAGK
ncbi:hypothetical protein SISSUDRAFT_955896, partial [Sistotremastrum suecicum HHB10207 ss-3]